MVPLTQPGWHIHYFFMQNSLPSNLSCIIAAVALLAGPGPGFAQDPAPSPAPAADSSSALATAAWSAFDRKDYAAARAAIERCRSLYGAQAAEMQSKLNALPAREEGHQQWALNDVGTCTFLLGKVAEAEGQKDEAMAAYRMVVDQYSYSQCWDQQGWFWQPAVAAKERLAALTLDAE
jgi:hypothetical protein